MSAAVPALLVSVRDAAEALDALAGGADWIDLKEPRRGALGAVGPEVARDVVRVVASRVQISAAGGELLDWPDAPARELLDVPGISHIKLGLARCKSTDWRQAWLAAQQQIAAAGKQLVAVIYADAERADAPQPEQVLATAGASDCQWILWDTLDKAAGPLAVHMCAEDLETQLIAARQAQIRTVVAGSLDAAALESLPLTLVDMVAVRGAACRGSREDVVCRDKVTAFRRALVTSCSAAGKARAVKG